MFRRVQDWMNPPSRLTDERFDVDAPLAAPSGPYRSAHHGIVIPELPRPLCFLSVITMFGRPPIRLRRQGPAATSARTTASVFVGTAAPQAWHSADHGVAASEVNTAGTVFRFGDGIALTGRYPRFRLGCELPGLGVDLTITATDVVTTFAAMRGGLYDHQSVLCRYQGTVTHHGGERAVTGLCALEYARGKGAGLSFRWFTYHVINIDDRTQVLFTEVLGPAGVPVSRAAYVRRLGEGSRTYRTGFTFTPAPPGPPHTGRGGLPWQLPAAFSVAVSDDDRDEVFRITATTRADWAKGPLGGYAAGYDYEGVLQGKPVSGIGYGEYVDNRRKRQGRRAR